MYKYAYGKFYLGVIARLKSHDARVKIAVFCVLLKNAQRVKEFKELINNGSLKNICC
jgi:hypothetical protein